ncbi:hypothetical protein V2K77_14840 [Pseudomonas alliivorans]|nr:hypothetical protein [Pseudomonas alliivorans]MEE4711249.1 hypothetical protein [Pseudomonas alliivorans]MEE4727080.1 hypothetical protein [Pseudomonas alliivorans]MEE4768814.1 hypothetical protein [Pseudomonas alliivorans]MEE5037871.1 hypothetical protein [Pseudomonas alliivorans]
MQKIDNLTQEKLRDWQIRRLEIKDQMQLHPEKTLDLSRVLDIMDEEHAAILGGSMENQSVEAEQLNSIVDRTVAGKDSLHSATSTFELQLHVAASSPHDLRKLLKIAVYELLKQIKAQAIDTTCDRSSCPGSMSGTLGEYHFELDVNNGAKHG